MEFNKKLQATGCEQRGCLLITLLIKNKLPLAHS
jgi:hypothetical protein